MAGERELVCRCEDAEPPLACFFDEHRLGETEIRRDTLAILLRHLARLKKHAQGVATGASFAEEDLEDV
jgi:hypothetical protein